MNGSGTSQHLKASEKQSTGLRAVTRKCTGECNRLRSVAQFKGDSTVCIRCENRMPKS